MPPSKRMTDDQLVQAVLDIQLEVARRLDDAWAKKDIMAVQMATNAQKVAANLGDSVGRIARP